MALKGTAAFPLTVVSGGINRLRTKGGADKNSLYDLLNGYVTASNTVKVRPGTTRNANLGPVSGAGVTKGLVGYQGELHVFAPSVVPVPAGYQLHVLGHPASALPPSTPAANVQSLMHFEDGNGSTTFTDNGTAGATWAAVAGAAESTTQSKFGTGSLSVPATANACIETPVIAGGQLDLTQQDYTVEGWFYTASWANNQYLMDFTGPSNNILFEVYLDVSGAIHIKDAGTGAVESSANGAFTKSTWHHVAVTRYGSLVSLYLDGAIVSSAITLTTELFGQVIPASYFIGVGGGFQSTILGFNGYIDDFRIVNGQAVYQATGFTPPTSTLTTYVAPYSSAVGTVLAFDDGSGSTAFMDTGVHAQTWTGSAGAVESTVQQQFGVGSLFLPGTDDYIATPQLSGGPLDLTNEDFTVECWAFPTSTTLANSVANGDAILFDFSAGGNTLFRCEMSSTGTVEAQVFGAWGGHNATSVATLNLNTWNHVVVMRRNNVIVVGVNGSLYYSSSAVGAATGITSGQSVFVGSGHDSNIQHTGFEGGYIDQFTITTGVAKYGSRAYTVPPEPPVATAYTVIPLKEIHFAAPYLGGLYVVAEFETVAGVNGGTVFHYWIQSSISGSNVNEWTANTDYQIGDVVIPDTPNGLTYVASRKSAPNPTWTPSTAAHAASTGVAATVVEPTVPNGFMYTAVSTLGTNPTTGETEPTWPTSDGATVQDLSELSNDASISNLPTISPPTPAPTTPTRYIPLLGG